MRSSRLIALALAVVTLAGCVRTPGPTIFARNAPPPWARPVAAYPVSAPEPLVYAQPIPELQPVAFAAPDGPYTLDSGDRLRVVVFGQEGLSNSYTVDPSGSITMPLIGAVPARGMTVAALQQAIAARLRQGFIREPHVAAEVEAYRPFFILGEVTLPGQYPYVANMTVETAVAIAGGYTPRAFKRIVEISRPIDGVITRQKVPAGYPVKPGDTVIISERWF